MVQQVKLLAAKSDNLILIPGTHMVERQLPQMSFYFHMCAMAHVYVHTISKCEISHPPQQPQNNKKPTNLLGGSASICLACL